MAAAATQLPDFAAAAAGVPGDYVWLTAVGGIACFLTAFAIGANDVANTFSSSVGSRALPLWAAICLAAVLECVGATLLGGAVTDSIRSKIIAFDAFEQTPSVLMSGMLCALLGAGAWLTLANRLGLPVSTTHAIVGALLGFGCASGNLHAVQWRSVAYVFLSWLLAPIAASLAGALVFAIVRSIILRKPDSLQRAQRLLWLFIWFITLTFSTFLVFKNYFEIDRPCEQLVDGQGIVTRRPCRISRWADAHIGLATAVAVAISIVLTACITCLVYRFASRRLALHKRRLAAAATAAACAAAGGAEEEEEDESGVAAAAPGAAAIIGETTTMREVVATAASSSALEKARTNGRYCGAVATTTTTTTITQAAAAATEGGKNPSPAAVQTAYFTAAPVTAGSGVSARAEFLFQRQESQQQPQIRSCEPCSGGELLQQSQLQHYSLSVITPAVEHCATPPVSRRGFLCCDVINTVAAGGAVAHSGKAAPFCKETLSEEVLNTTTFVTTRAADPPAAFSHNNSPALLDDDAASHATHFYIPTTNSERTSTRMLLRRRSSCTTEAAAAHRILTPISAGVSRPCSLAQPDAEVTGCAATKLRQRKDQASAAAAAADAVCPPWYLLQSEKTRSGTCEKIQSPSPHSNHEYSFLSENELLLLTRRTRPSASMQHEPKRSSSLRFSSSNGNIHHHQSSPIAAASAPVSSAAVACDCAACDVDFSSSLHMQQCFSASSLHGAAPAEQQQQQQQTSWNSSCCESANSCQSWTKRASVSGKTDWREPPGIAGTTNNSDKKGSGNLLVGFCSSESAVGESVDASPFPFREDVVNTVAGSALKVGSGCCAKTWSVNCSAVHSPDAAAAAAVCANERAAPAAAAAGEKKKKCNNQFHFSGRDLPEGEVVNEYRTCFVNRKKPWRAQLLARWQNMPWFKDLHAEGQTEDELVARLQTSAEVFDGETEVFFSACQVVSACMGCIAHSANDTANAIGPFAAILSIYEAGSAAGQVASPWYVLLFGGLSMSLGLALLGYRVIKTVGVKLVKITPARGFAMDLGAAWTVLVFSAFGIPLSTTHCAVGSTVGVGLLEPRQGHQQQEQQVLQSLWHHEKQPQHHHQERLRSSSSSSTAAAGEVSALLTFGKREKLKRWLRTFCLLQCLNTSSVNWKLFGGVFLSWIVTILFSALVSASLFSFSAYSPRLVR